MLAFRFSIGFWITTANLIGTTIVSVWMVQYANHPFLSYLVNNALPFIIHWCSLWSPSDLYNLLGFFLTLVHKLTKRLMFLFLLLGGMWVSWVKILFFLIQFFSHCHRLSVCSWDARLYKQWVVAKWGIFKEQCGNVLSSIQGSWVGHTTISTEVSKHNWPLEGK